MKHIKIYEKWFFGKKEEPEKDGDYFVKDLIDIIQQKNLNVIKKYKHSDIYEIIYGEHLYRFEKEFISPEYECYLKVFNIGKESKYTPGYYPDEEQISKVEISFKYYDKIKQIGEESNKLKEIEEKEIQRKKNIANLPTITDSAIMGKKYNL